MDETINIEEYIGETYDNIVICYGDNKYFFTQRSVLFNQLNDSTIYPCREDSGVIPEKNIMGDIPLYNIKNVGLLLNACDMSDLWENSKGQLFVYKETNIKFPTFVSYNVLQGGDWVSALHCQEGQESNVGKIKTAIPTTVNMDQYLGKPELRGENNIVRRLFGGKKRKTIKKKNIKKKKSKNSRKKQ